MSNTSDQLFDILKNCIDLPDRVCELTIHLNNRSDAVVTASYYPTDMEGKIMINRSNGDAIKKKVEFKIRRLKDGN